MRPARLVGDGWHDGRNAAQGVATTLGGRRRPARDLPQALVVAVLVQQLVAQVEPLRIGRDGRPRIDAEHRVVVVDQRLHLQRGLDLLARALQRDRLVKRGLVSVAGQVAVRGRLVGRDRRVGDLDRVAVTLLEEAQVRLQRQRVRRERALREAELRQPPVEGLQLRPDLAETAIIDRVAHPVVEPQDRALGLRQGRAVAPGARQLDGAAIGALAVLLHALAVDGVGPRLREVYGQIARRLAVAQRLLRRLPGLVRRALQHRARGVGFLHLGGEDTVGLPDRVRQRLRGRADGTRLGQQCNGENAQQDSSPSPVSPIVPGHSSAQEP